MTNAPTSYCDLKTLAAQLSVSRRTIRNWVNAAPPLPAYRPGGKLLFRWAEVQAWLEQNHRVQTATHRGVADEIVSMFVKQKES